MFYRLFRYFFLRTKSSKDSIRVSKFDTLVSRLSKMITVKVNQLITAEVRKIDLTRLYCKGRTRAPLKSCPSALV